MQNAESKVQNETRKTAAIFHSAFCILQSAFEWHRPTRATTILTRINPS
jgi:hypothetical protein